MNYGFTTDNVRITPACAGKSLGIHKRANVSRDHPRVCGEKAASVSKSIPAKGSPPRVRGKVDRTACVAEDDGITPACAGKSPFSAA